ncbi:FtsW/RodA/SpoVE family cell cycle protein [Longimicrobium sp.]|uniref:FtsW/RodA/SpoVE family cell cycle protein n=1 Tax=Longimicrobium sp. TaxID=2029185 RepID=UPI002C815A00|nr:FtsW/RodA/SpoVE family cell cycle protein [Longimicrobium sp.]HSU17062.1 FtsW/RodA/SpoVE family cell cycle protein [Longimicrobium sp.]
MALRDLFRRRSRGSSAAGPLGVTVRVKAHNVPGAETSGRVFPAPIWWGLLLAVVFYALAHASIILGVWPVHGTSPGAGGILLRDALALVAWGIVILVLRKAHYRGAWGIVVLPVIIFCLSRPAQFQAFTDPAYQARGGARSQANDLKATRSRLSTIDRVYSAERKELVYQGTPPPLPDPFKTAVGEETRGFFAKSATYFPVFIAPLLVLVGYLVIARQTWLLRWIRDRKLLVFIPAMLVFFGLAMVPSARTTGKVAGTTPWELILPFLVATWAAVLADDAYNLARPGSVVSPRRLGSLVLYGALPIVPFLIIHELGLSIVLATSFAAMLLVGTRRGWWAALLLVVWMALVMLVFRTDDRSQTRAALAYHPYRDLSGMAPADQEKWAGKVHQIKLFDANVLAGEWLGDGPGRGHGETAPNAADDGFFTLIAAQWGWTGGVALVLVYTVFLVELLTAAVRERGAYERCIVTGLSMLIAVPFWLAALGDMRVIPLTGVAAAFAAHGGAKLLASAFGVGIIAGISHRRTEETRMAEVLAPPEERVEADGIRVR